MNGWDLENNRNTKKRIMVNFEGKKKLVALDDLTFEDGTSILDLIGAQDAKISEQDAKITKLNDKLNKFIEITKNGGLK